MVIINNGWKNNKEMLMTIPLLIIIVQVIPILILLRWGYTSHKLNEYYIRIRLFFSSSRKKGKTKAVPAFMKMGADGNKVGQRRISLEMRLEA